MCLNSSDPWPLGGPEPLIDLLVFPPSAEPPEALDPAELEEAAAMDGAECDTCTLDPLLLEKVLRRRIGDIDGETGGGGGELEEPRRSSPGTTNWSLKIDTEGV